MSGMTSTTTSSTSTEPMYYKILDRFGLPTLFALITFALLIAYNKQVREDARVERTAFIQALEKNTAAVEGVGAAVREGTKATLGNAETLRRMEFLLMHGGSNRPAAAYTATPTSPSASDNR